MKKILIVDDDQPLAEVLGMFLQTFGYPQASFAHDGGEGLLFMREHPEVTLIFTDLEMPNVDGREFIVGCRKAGYTTKIIYMSGTIGNDDDLVAIAKEIGADAALPKPFLPHKVLDALTIAGVNPSMFK